jgi:hypothetical protein
MQRDLGVKILLGGSDHRDVSGGEVCEVVVPWSFGNLSPEFSSGGSEIWSRSVSTSWQKIVESKVSGRCARPRGKRRCKSGIKRRPKLTAKWR